MKPCKHGQKGIGCLGIWYGLVNQLAKVVDLVKFASGLSHARNGKTGGSCLRMSKINQDLLPQA